MSRTRTLTTSQFIARPVDEVFAFFAARREPGPDHALGHGLRVPHRGHPDARRPDDRLPAPAAARHPDALAHADHASRAAARFTDIQARGPYRRWEHSHTFLAGRGRHAHRRRGRLRTAPRAARRVAHTAASSAASSSGSSATGPGHRGDLRAGRGTTGRSPSPWPAAPASSAGRSRRSCIAAATGSSSCRTAGRRLAGPLPDVDRASGGGRHRPAAGSIPSAGRRRCPGHRARFQELADGGAAARSDLHDGRCGRHRAARRCGARPASAPRLHVRAPAPRPTPSGTGSAPSGAPRRPSAPAACPSTIIRPTWIFGPRDVSLNRFLASPASCRSCR